VLKTATIEKQLTLNLESEEFAGIQRNISGRLTSNALDDNTILDITTRPLPLKSQEDKQQQFSKASSLVFRWERYGHIAQEILPLWKRHWKEIALHQEHVPLAPDFDRYYAYDLNNVLHILTVRDDGMLVGYVFLLVMPGHLHYCDTSWAVSDMFWLHPSYRFGWTGIKMLKEAEKGMRARGVKILQWSIKFHFEAERGTIEKLFTRMGYFPSEKILSKYLG